MYVKLEYLFAFTPVRAVASFASLFFGCHAIGDTFVNYDGFTWTFSEDEVVGFYCTGEPWVVGPVSITSITPESEVSEGWIKNGTMVNPTLDTSQGYDNSMDYNGYSSGLNVAPSATGQDLVVSSGSILSSISKSTQDNRPQVQRIAILTVVDSAPPNRSFRPPYVGNDKRSYWTADDLDFALLNSLARPETTPNINSVVADIQRPWIEHGSYNSWTDRYIHPAENQPDYGREIAREYGQALMLLHLDFSESEKEPLYINLVQRGIDIYGAAVAGKVWRDLGGHNHGRKMPMLLAGLALGDAEILSFADAAQHFIFQEDRQTWYITESDVGRALYTRDGRPRDEYIASDVGNPEWGEQHTSQKVRDGRNWNATYRDIVHNSLMGHALVAQLTPGAVDSWNWSAFFDYMDRAFEIDQFKAGEGSNKMTYFERDMWLAYRDAKPDSITSTPIATPSGGFFSESVVVTLEASTPASVIYYTTDGTTPTELSPVYSEGILLSDTTILKTFAKSNGFEASLVRESSYLFGNPPVPPSDLILLSSSE